jgi:hypothetical protein
VFQPARDFSRGVGIFSRILGITRRKCFDWRTILALRFWQLVIPA